MKQHLTLEAFATEVTRRAEAKVDYVIPTEFIKMTPDANQIELADGGDLKQTFDLTDWCENQIAAALFPSNKGKVSMPVRTYRYMKATEPDLLADLVNGYFKRRSRNRMLRTLDGKARSWHSDGYQRLDDKQFVETALPSMLSRYPDAQVVSCAITETNTYLNMVTPQLEKEVQVGDLVQFGLHYSNSEVGAGQLEAGLLAYQLRCLNGMKSQEHLFGARHFGQRHGQRNLREIFKLDTKLAEGKATLLKLRDFCDDALNEDRINSHIRTMKGLTEIEIASPRKAVKVLAKEEGLTEGEADSILAHLIKGGELTAWGLQNAVTAAAQDYRVSVQRGNELEALGGKMLDLSRKEYRVLETA